MEGAEVDASDWLGIDWCELDIDSEIDGATWEVLSVSLLTNGWPVDCEGECAARLFTAVARVGTGASVVYTEGLLEPGYHHCVFWSNLAERARYRRFGHACPRTNHRRIRHRARSVRCDRREKDSIHRDFEQ